MIALMLLAALAQERYEPRRHDPVEPRMQEDIRRRADELRAALDRTEDEDERARLTAELARLEAQMAAGHRMDEAEFDRVERETTALLKEQGLDLGNLKESRPEEYREILMHAWQMTRGRDGAPDSDLQKSLLVAEVKIQILAVEARDGHATDEAKAKLRAAVEELFDLRVRLRERELAELEARMEEVRSRLAKQKENKKAIVDDRVKELTGEKRDLEFP